MPQRQVASFCSTFLAPEMRHVYRQITGLRRYRSLVLTHKRLHPERFPFPDEDLIVLPRPRSRELRRFWYRRVKRAPWPLYRSEVERIEGQLREHGAEVLHIYFGHIACHLLPLLRSPTLPCPAVVSFHGADAGVDVDKPGYRRALEAVLDQAAAVLARSQSLLDQLAALGCPPDKLHLQRTGIPLGDWPRHPREAPQEDRWKLVQACRLVPKKGIDLSLEALAQVREFLPNVSLDLLGEGPLLNDLREQVDRLGLTGAVRFTGFLDQEELLDRFKHSHLFLAPSRTPADGNREGVPNAMLEAMATGIPVVGSRHGGIPEAVRDGQEGRLVAEEDAAALAGAILEILRDAPTWQHMANAARGAVMDRFEQGHQIENLETIYDAVAQEATVSS